jgi:hypothetical protein
MEGQDGTIAAEEVGFAEDRSRGDHGMPQPIQKFLGGRMVAALIVLLLPVLYLSGMVAID